MTILILVVESVYQRLTTALNRLDTSKCINFCQICPTKLDRGKLTNLESVYMQQKLCRELFFVIDSQVTFYDLFPVNTMIYRGRYLFALTAI